VPLAASRTALDRLHLRGLPGLTFARSLGTGHGRSFTPRDADPRRWALLTVWRDRESAAAFATDQVPVRWQRHAEETWRVDLRPLSARGRWSGRAPFGDPGTVGSDGPVAALTRARIATARSLRFWRALPPVTAALAAAPGLRLAFGIGEAPVGLQGTFSVWESAEALRRFAYADPAHAGVVARTPAERWYAEELFARFAVESSVGTVDGRDPLGVAS
jgi:heme-degrading monooxygenase HmoA